MWIRNPWWDGCWMLSGIPIGAVLILLSLWLPFWVIPYASICPTPHSCDAYGVMGGLIAIYAVVLLDFGHNISPMVLAWSHAEFRSVILRRPIKFIALPLSLLVAGVFVGIATETWWTDFHPFINSALSMTEIYPPRATNPFWWLLAVYLVWNFYHFAKQNF